MGPLNYNHEFPQNVSAGQPKFCPAGLSHRLVTSRMSDKSLEVAGHKCRKCRYPGSSAGFQSPQCSK
ncbi:hypothetical protein Pan258_58260 [Symmachiella dynata]|uniref:Uncharacterized protein n=1 Tax=Symmachiella dynata TaxID=2527995 RepID=A0A517ZYA3_9PLAN|nr:hypothetical protein Pan258_58260 [Symmachiella dynata]QDU47426.1 hypothetical protein Mal52_59570 [Symmachiella dynata]